MGKLLLFASFCFFFCFLTLLLLLILSLVCHINIKIQSHNSVIQLSRLPAQDEVERHLQTTHFQCMAAGDTGTQLKFFFYARQVFFCLFIIIIFFLQFILLQFSL